jgi:hypothetical protein
LNTYKKWMSALIIEFYSRDTTIFTINLMQMFIFDEIINLIS